MDKLELELKKYLETEEGNKIIKKSLDESWITYHRFSIESVIIEDDESFEIKVFLDDHLSPAVSVLPLPKKFLRKMKLNNLDKIN